MSRFGVLGRDTDRDQIRSLASRLAEDGLQADRLRTIIHNETNARAPTSSEIVHSLRKSPLVGADIVADRPYAYGREIEL